MNSTEKSWEDRAAEIGSSAMSSIREMVAALECDYERLEELRNERDGYYTCDTCGKELDDSMGEADKPFVSCECGMAKMTRAECWAKDRPDDAAELAELESAAGECEDRDDAERRIQDDPLSLQFRSGWTTSREDMEPEEFELLLGTGGPAVRIIGGIDRGEPCNPQLQVQDWFKPWTDYNGDSDDDAALEMYCRQFYFGE